MLSDKANDYIDAVLSFVNYSFDRKKIRLELTSHLNDKIEFYLRKGNVEAEAEALAIRDMGNARETGEALNKMHKPVLGWMLKHIKAFAIAIVLIICGITLFNVGASHARNQKIKQDTHTYINNLYWEINSTSNLLSHVESWGNSINSLDLSQNPFSQLLFRLNTMKSLSQTAISYIGYTEDLTSVSNIANSFDVIYQSIGGGVTYNNQLICYDFLKDGVLSEREIKFLTSLKEDLGAIEERLINDRTNDYNLNMPLEEFAEIINPFINKYKPSNLTGIGLAN